MPRNQQFERMKIISTNEGLNISDKIINYLIEISEGDLRRSINLLQSISQLGEGLMRDDIINDVCGTIPSTDVSSLFDTARYQNTDVLMREANNFFVSGYDLRQFITQLNEFVVSKEDLTDNEKSTIFELIMNCEISLLENSSAQIQLYNLLCGIRKIFSMS